MHEFTGDINGHTVRVSFRGDRAMFTIEELPGSRFESFEKLENAVQAHDLETRKDFANKEAVCFSYGSLQVVEVTSISANGKDAWIKKNGKREKVSRNDLFADMVQVLEVRDEEIRLKRQIEELWKTAARWEPQTREEKCK